MTDELPDAVKRKLVVNRLSHDLIQHPDYEDLEKARIAAEALYTLHEKDSTFSFERRRQHRISERYIDASGHDTVSAGIEHAEAEIDELGSSLTMLSPFLI